MPPTVTEHPTPLPQVRLFRSDPEVDCFAVICERLVLVVDTFGTPEEAGQMMERLRPELGGRALAVVNTHWHYDHAWGNQLFAADGPYPAPIYAHEAGRPYWERVAQQFVTEPPKEERFAGVRLTPPTVTFPDRLTLHGGDLTLQLLPAPGHSADQVVVWIPELRTLLAADALEFPFPYAESAETLPTLLETFRTLQALEPEIVLPCHGGTTSPELIDQNLGYFARLREVVEAAKVPADWETASDLPAQLGYPFGQALAELGAADLPNPDFYRDLHLTNVRATVQASRL